MAEIPKYFQHFTLSTNRHAQISDNNATGWFERLTGMSYKTTIQMKLLVATLALWRLLWLRPALAFVTADPDSCSRRSNPSRGLLAPSSVGRFLPRILHHHRPNHECRFRDTVAVSLLQRRSGTRLDAIADAKHLLWGITTSKTAVAAVVASSLRGGVSDDVLASEAFQWCSNLGAPAALVAGAVLATLSSTRNELTPLETDGHGAQLRKKICRVRSYVKEYIIAKAASSMMLSSFQISRCLALLQFLLLSAFAFEVFCIFVTTVT